MEASVETKHIYIFSSTNICTSGTTAISLQTEALPAWQADETKRSHTNTKDNKVVSLQFLLKQHLNIRKGGGNLPRLVGNNLA